MFFFDTCKDNNAVANAMKLASNAEPQLTLCKGKKSLERIAIPLDEKKNVHLKENPTAFRGRIFLINKKCDLVGNISDSLGVFVIPQEYLVSFYQNTLLIAILKALIIRDKYLIIRFF